MSFYNMIHGVNSFAGLWLSMLELKPEDTGRFRDCYLADDEGKLRIFVYTRNGGGNRDEYQGVIDILATHPNYVRDFDDDYDCTYATIVFDIPEKFVNTIPEIHTLIENKHPEEKWEEFISKLQK